MKKWIEKLVAIIALAWFAIFAVWDTIHDFTANDTIHYFAKQPDRLILVAVIGIVGGLCAFVFDRLSPRGKRNARLIALGIVASSMMVLAVLMGYVAISMFKMARGLPVEIIPKQWFLFFILETVGLGAVAVFLWFCFYRILKNKTMDSPNRAN
ncbi:MAG TPA: hypothetical protein VFM25_13375 [Verrucomicrobiae bacterium]|nr:hypothetical protein [Verrucomicrobiae bacterium]